MKIKIFLLGLLMSFNVFSMGNELMFTKKNEKSLVFMPHEQDDLYNLQDFTEEIDESRELAIYPSIIMVAKQMHSQFDKKHSARL